MNRPRGTNEAFAFSIADELARCGVVHVCISPGSRSGPLALAFEREARLQTHVHLDERSAAFFALGIGRASKKPAVVVCTSGSATANLFPAIVEARQDFVPMIVLTADRPPELRATGANQTVDQLKMFGDAVVWFAEVGVPDEARTSPGYWRALVCRAVSESTTVGGPAHLNLALREPLFPDRATPVYPLSVEGREGNKPWTEFHPAVTEPSEQAISELARLVGGSERGVVAAGAVDAELSPLLDLAAVAGWPVLAEPASNIRVPGTISTYDALLRSDRFLEAHRPEVILRVGKLALGRPLARFLRDAHQVALAPPGRSWDEQRGNHTVLNGEPGLLGARVARELSPRPPTSWLDSWRRHDALARRIIDEILDSTDQPSEPRTARDLAMALPDGGHLFGASSMPVRELDAFMVPRHDITLHANRGANGIDGNLSTALGIAAATGTPTAVLIGDLALLHDSTSMLHSDRADHDVTVVVINNDGGGIFSFLEQAGVPDFERVFGTPHGIDLQRWAHAYDVPHRRLERASALTEIVRSDRGVRLVEVRTDRDENVDLHRRIWQQVEEALASDA